MGDATPAEIEQIRAEARAEKAGYLRGKGWTEEQIAAYLAGIRWIGWRVPWWMNMSGRNQFAQFT